MADVLVVIDMQNGVNSESEPLSRYNNHFCLCLLGKPYLVPYIMMSLPSSFIRAI